jgi:hypothetical protein
MNGPDSDSSFIFVQALCVAMVWGLYSEKYLTTILAEA